MANGVGEGEQQAQQVRAGREEVYGSHTQGRDDLCGVGISVAHEEQGICIASIYPCGAAAYSGQLAVGDIVNAVDEIDTSSLTASEVASLLLGTHGTLVRLSVSEKGAHLSRVGWMMRFQRSWYSSLSDDMSLGILAEASEDNTESWEITAISRGGGAWLGSFAWNTEGMPEEMTACLRVGDVIESVNGQRKMASVAAIKDAFTDLPFSRTSIGIRRQGAGLTIRVIRTPFLSGAHLELCGAYINALTQAMREHRSAEQQSRNLHSSAQSTPQFQTLPPKRAVPELGQHFNSLSASPGITNDVSHTASAPHPLAVRQHLFREPEALRSSAPRRSPEKSREEHMIFDAMEGVEEKEQYDALLHLLAEWDRLQLFNIRCKPAFAVPGPKLLPQHVWYKRSFCCYQELTKSTIKSIENSQSRAQSSASSVVSFEGGSRCLLRNPRRAITLLGQIGQKSLVFVLDFGVYAVTSGPDVAYFAISLRACYAKSGTDIAYQGPEQYDLIHRRQR